MQLVLVGCTQVKVVPNPDHCARNEGDRYCAELFPELPYCNHGQGECSIGDRYGCVAEVAPECHEPCGVLEDGECQSSESTGTDTGTATETESETGSESSTTGAEPCGANEDCVDAAVPFCEPGSGECVACDGVDDPDGACSGVDPGLPVCEGGACVQCTAEKPGACTGKTPVCDEGTSTCVPCTAHDQCGGAACNLFIGACLPADAVVHVGGETPDFGTLTEAVASIAVEEEGTIVVHEGMPDYNEAVTVSAGRTIAFLAADDIDPELGPPQWAGLGDEPQLTVAAGTTVLMDGLQLSLNGSSAVPAVLVNGGRAWLDRSRVVQNSGGGIVAQSNAELVLRNCFVGGGGGGHPAAILDDTTARVTNSTLANTAVAATPALECVNASSLSLRNSVVVTEGGAAGVELACSGADVTYSATEAPVVGTGNVGVGTFPDGVPETWFVSLSTGDFHLQNDGLSVFAGIALWQAGDPPTDIDGDPRPGVDGTADYVGADVPVMAAGRLEADR